MKTFPTAYNMSKSETNGGYIMNNRINVKAVIDFAFRTDPDLSPAEMMEELVDRIKSGDYFPEDLIRLQVIPA